MFRDLILLVLGALLLANIWIGNYVVAVCLAVVAYYHFRGRSLSHLLERQLNYLAARLLQSFIAMLLVGSALIIFGLQNEDWLGWTILLIAAFFPVTALLVLRGKLARDVSKLAQDRITKIIRCILEAKTSVVATIFINLLGVLLFALQPIVTLPQIILLELLLLLPIQALRRDKASHKLLSVSAHNFKAHTMSRQMFNHYLRFSIFAGSAAVVSYLLVFLLNATSPQHVDASLPLHQQATVVTFLTLFCCSFAAILFERVDPHEQLHAEMFFDNPGLWKAAGTALSINVLLVYLPFAESWFDLTSINLTEWSVVVLMTGVYCGLRLLQRHTRKHTRHALIELHTAKS